MTATTHTASPVTRPSDGPRPGGGSSLTAALRDNRPTIALGAAAVIVTAIIFAFLPPQREASSLARFLFQLVPFVLAAEGIARLTLTEAHRLKLALVATPLTFLGIFCWFVPRMFFNVDDFPKFYVIVLQMVPFIILAMTLAFRLGGGPSALCRRLAAAMLLLMLSGLEDLAFLKVNHQTDPAWNHIPARWNWASHMKVFLGHYPTKYEAFAFVGVHVILAGLVLFLPARYFLKLRSRSRSSSGR